MNVLFFFSLDHEIPSMFVWQISPPFVCSFFLHQIDYYYQIRISYRQLCVMHDKNIFRFQKGKKKANQIIIWLYTVSCIPEWIDWHLKNWINSNWMGFQFNWMIIRFSKMYIVKGMLYLCSLSINRCSIDSLKWIVECDMKKKKLFLSKLVTEQCIGLSLRTFCEL